MPQTGIIKYAVLIKAITVMISHDLHTFRAPGEAGLLYIAVTSGQIMGFQTIFCSQFRMF